MTGEALDCALCPDLIAPGTNYATLPDGRTAHPWCDFRERQQREAAERAAHLPGCLCDDERCPAPCTPVSGYVRQLRRAFRSTGLDGCVLWHRPDGRPWRDGRWAETPEIGHSEFALSASRQWSDLPGRVPGALVRAQTPCVTGDLGEPEPGADMRQGLQGAYLCRLGHVHHGKSPYGRDGIPREVRDRISASLGEEARRDG